MKAKTRSSNLKPQNSQLGYGDYLRFRDLVLERSGLHFHEKKKVDLEAGLFKALAKSPLPPVNGHYNLDEYYKLLCDQDSPTGRAEMRRLINTLTVGETYFFRDEAQFNALATQVLPAIIRRKRAAATAVGPNIQPQLRIWSAGCASGEEPYSVAILLKELLPDIENWHILILATDINQDALARAGEGVYSDWSFREARAKALRSYYFTRGPAMKAPPAPRREEKAPPVKGGAGSRLGNRYRLRDDIRRMVTFAPLNLIEDNYPAIHNNTVSMDLILCRNVTIYFTEEITRQVVKRFYGALVLGGWLVVGHAEPSLVTYRAFQAHTFPDTILYQKTDQPSPWPDDWEWLADIYQEHRANSVMAPPASQRGERWDDISRMTNTHPDTGVVTTNSKPTTDLLTRLQSSPSRPQERNGRLTTRPLHPPTPKPPSNTDPYQTASMLLNKGQVEEAIKELHRKLAIAPDFAPAHSLLGRAYANLGRWAEARQWCQSALELDSLLAEAYHVLGLVYQHEEQFEPAIDMLKKAIYLEREVALPHFSLTMLYKQVGQINNARRACQNTIRVLEKWPPAGIIPDSGGATAKHLLEVARRVLNELEMMNPYPKSGHRQGRCDEG